MFKIFRKIRTVINNPNWFFIRILCKVSPLLRDEVYLKMLFPLRAGYKLNLDNPQTFNEKLQWLKINYRTPLLTILADKYEAKKYTKAVIGEQYVVKNYGCWDSFDEIDFSQLPEQFVLKTTHDQGGVVLCRDKSKFDKEKAKIKLNKHLKKESYLITREWPYKNVKPRIMAEELLNDEEKGDIWDYKFYCFHGKPKVMYISMGRQTGHVPLYFYDMEFNQLDITRPKHKCDDKKLDKPKHWDLMIDLATKASANLPHVRVDFYSIGDRVYSGEYTFFQGGGMMPFYPESWDYKFGQWIELDKLENTKF